MSKRSKYDLDSIPQDPPYLQPGALVEIQPPEFGYESPWHTATIVQRATPISSNRFVVRFTHLFQDEKTGNRPLRMISLGDIRPHPPPTTWWEGVIVQELKNGNYLFRFNSDNQWPKFVEFGVNQLRLHRTWINGQWIPPLEASEIAVEEVQREEEPTKKTMEMEEYNERALVEVANDEDGSNRAWYPAIIVTAVGNKRYLIQYTTMRTDDNSNIGFFGKVRDTLHIRPRPPDIAVPDQFVMLEQVDAFYKGGWWKGVIIKVLSDDSKYHVYLATHEEMEFKHSELRLHQDWIDGKWTKPSPGVHL
ncbi:hypothetical protein E1A91_A03G027300v1 [Gossypium mustelinum]|uniref:Agenet domain-containing protein n=1 Tax=Gossypium mustelinum TaxID=34275 RepID=A0A5D2ZRR1_GOSMU|nr:hypothetical protein E1A91_A03G027300v1 [Gossypium mustelinum]